MREWLIHRMQAERNGNSRTGTIEDDTVQTSDSVTEMTRLLGAEEIALDTFCATSDTLPTADSVAQLTGGDDDDAIIELESQQ